jgi:hypothetical protein
MNKEFNGFPAGKEDVDQAINLVRGTDQEIKNKVYTIRGLQVMLDSDLAELYGVEVKRLNEQVRRNNKRFPREFMFQLTAQEI